MTSVGWDGRDVSGLSHEQIHRWTRDGASPEALAAARDRHLARADELRGAADRLQAAQRGVGETWVGRDADAAGSRTRVLAQRLEQLAQTVGGQARGIDGMRAALVRVQATVGPPRPPALPTLGVTPVLDELRSLVTGRPADGYGGFRAAAADQAAAREAYRTYLSETATAARTVGPAGAGPAPPPVSAPATPVGPGRAPLPTGARGAASGVLQRAAAPAGPGVVPTAGAGSGVTTGDGLRPPVVARGVAPEAPVRAPVGPALPAGGPGPTVVPGGSAGAGAAAGGAAPGSAAVGTTVSGGGVSGGGAVPGRGAVPGPAGPGGSAGAAPGAPVPSGGGGAPVGAPVPGTRGTRPIGPGDGGSRPDERAPSAVGGPPGRPGVLDDHRRGGFGPDAAPAEDPERAATGDRDDRVDRVDREEVVVPVRPVTWLVDPDPVGWGGSGRRVAPPVLGEGP